MSRKYEELIFNFPAEYNDFSLLGGTDDFIMSPQAYFRGGSQIPGAKYNVGFQIFIKPFFLDRVPHRHNVDEYLFFLGGNLPNMFDFDADIEFTIGKEGEDAETYHITKPTIIRVPAGVYHCPLNFKRVDKPVFFQAALMQEMFSNIYDLDNGKEKELWYNGPLTCKLDSSKNCDCCRKCIEGQADRV